MVPWRPASVPSKRARTTSPPSTGDRGNGPAMTSKPPGYWPMPLPGPMADLHPHPTSLGNVATGLQPRTENGSSKRSTCSNRDWTQNAKRHRPRPSLPLGLRAMPHSFVASLSVVPLSPENYFPSSHRGGLLHLLPLKKWTTFRRAHILQVSPLNVPYDQGSHVKKCND